MERLKRLKKISNEILFWILLFVVTVILFITVKPRLLSELEWARKGVIAQCVTISCLAILVIVGLFLSAYKKLNIKNLTTLLILAGFVIRVGYMLVTPVTDRQYDTQSSGHNGHEAYAWTIYSTGKLPTHNGYQFYHPPFNALLQAGFMHFFSSLTNLLSHLFGLESYFATKFSAGKLNYLSDERWLLFSSCQILAVIYSMVACVYMIKTIKLFGFSNRLNLVLYAFVIFFPRNFQLSGQVNNDSLSFTLSVLAIYWCLKWLKCGKKHRYIYLCALFCGLGIMTKLSSATVCLPIGVVFIYEFIKTLIKKSDISAGKIILQFFVFALICAPLALWFHVYAKVRFDQNFGYVFDGLNDGLSTKQHSIFSRFIFACSYDEWFGSIFASSWEDYALFNFVVRSALFGEFSFWQGEAFGFVALSAAYIGCGLIIIDIIYCIGALIKKSVKKEFSFKRLSGKSGEILFTTTLILSQVASMYYFYIKMPYGCTMDFRYILPMILGLALGLAYIFKTLKFAGSKLSKVLSCSTLAVISIFIVGSAGFYLMCV